MPKCVGFGKEKGFRSGSRQRCTITVQYKALLSTDKAISVEILSSENLDSGENETLNWKYLPLEI